MSITNKARDLSPKAWHDLLLRSIDDAKLTLDGHHLPGFPDAEIQRNLNGRLAKDSMKQAFDLFTYTRKLAQNHKITIDGAKVLDFGSGWGRIWRYFLYDIQLENNRAFDVNADLARFWENKMCGAKLDTAPAWEKLPYEDGTFSIIVSNSVFSHLSPKLNLFYASELRRVMAPGGLLVATTFGKPHLKTWKSWGSKKSLTERQKMIAGLSDDYQRDIAAFDKGEFIYLETGLPGRNGPNDHLQDYEIAAVPRPWLEQNWAPYFSVVDYSDRIGPQSTFSAIAI